MPSKIFEKVWGRDISNVADKGLIRSIGDYFGEDFSEIIFRVGGVLPYIVPFNYSAIVFGETINIKEGSEFVLKNPTVMAEELYHVVQWRRLGSLKLPVIYIMSHIKNGYNGNRIEVEAKKKARKYVRDMEEISR